ncbi:MAG: hypothetical protein NXY57DRAFT_1041973 [Lentinula lateritia]|nr:MAG: hypothetical protein NXY57DRAFT_1041973 [Lentinula lateritia]
MASDQSPNPSLSTLQHCFDCFQLNKDPVWGIQLTENENIRYLLECRGILSYPDSKPLQTTHLLSCPRKPPPPLGLAEDICLPISRTPASDLLHLDAPSTRSMMFNSSLLSEGLNEFEACDLSLNAVEHCEDDYPTQHRTLLQEFALIQCRRNLQPTHDSDLSCLGSELETKPAVSLDDMDGLGNLVPFGECNGEIDTTGDHDAPAQTSPTTIHNGLECLLQLTEQVLHRLASASNVYFSKIFRFSLPHLIVDLSLYIGWGNVPAQTSLTTIDNRMECLIQMTDQPHFAQEAQCQYKMFMVVRCLAFLR